MSGAPGQGGWGAVEITAVSTAIVAVLGLLGKGIWSLLTWLREGSVSRSAKLDGWHRELTEREKQIADAERDYRERIEHRLETLERENVALRQAFGVISAAVRQLDHGNPALVEAERILAAAFPLPDTPTPGDMVEQLGRIDRKESRTGRRGKA